MTIKQLTYFMSVARLLNFTDAARELYISQSALSRSIASLEAELGVALLERDHHSVSLTPAGTLLASELPNLRKELERVMLLVRQTENGLMGRLSIGVLEGQKIDEAVQVTFKYFSQNMPLVEVSPSRMDYTELIDDLDHDRLDLILTLDHGLSGRMDLELLKLDSVPYCMVLPEDHRLAGKNSAQLPNFRRDTFVVTGDETSSPETRFFISCCRRAGFEPICRQVADIRTKILWIESGFGISIFNAENRACHTSGLKAVPLTDVSPASLVLAWKADTRNPSVHLFTHTTECCL